MNIKELFPKEHRAYLIGGAWLLILFLNMVFLPRKYAPHVDVESVKLAPLPLIVRASGNLEAKDSNTVRAQFDGPVVTKKFREGEQVAKGQLLAVIGRDRILVDYQGKRDALANAQSDLTHARRDLRLQKQLYKKEAVAYSTVEDAQRALVKTEQALRSATATFALAQDQWNSSNVTAPIQGTLVKDWIGEDKFIAAGKEIVTIADISEYTVHARVDELDIHQIHEGQTASVRILTLSKSALPAVVTEVGSQLEGNGLPEIPIVLRLTAKDNADLRPKLTAEARVFTGQTNPTLSVPLTAIANSDGDPHVWVLDAIGRIKRQRVQLGKANPDRTEIANGLSAGQRVVVSAEPDFAEGMRVEVNPTAGR